MQSVREDTNGADDDDEWSNQLFELELIQSTPPQQASPQFRLGSASLQDGQSFGNRCSTILAMSTGGSRSAQPSQFESSEVEEDQPQSVNLRDQHRRGYQACDPCRKRKVKCDLGSNYVQDCDQVWCCYTDPFTKAWTTLMILLVCDAAENTKIAASLQIVASESRLWTSTMRAVMAGSSGTRGA